MPPWRVVRNLSCLLLVTLAPLLSGAAVSLRSPVILLPGLAGSVLEDRVDRSEVPAWYCARRHDWRVLWLSVTAASFPTCLLDEMRVFYDAATQTYHNHEGVEIRPHDFGGLGGVAALDPSLPWSTGWYQELIDVLVDDLGYEGGQDLFGAPYDFRLAADGLDQVGWFDQLRRLVEDARGASGGRRVFLLAHSMGNLVSLYFLAHQSQAWLDQHVAGLIALSAPWEGAVTALKASISGDNFDVYGLPADLLHPIQATAPSAPWLFPSPALWPDAVMVETQGGAQYTARDIPQLLVDLNHTQQAAVYPRVSKLTQPLPQLDVPVHCLYGSGIATEEAYTYGVLAFNSTAPPSPQEIRRGPGDGTVNKRSLEACARLGPKASLRAFPNVTHGGVLASKVVHAAIVDILRQHAAGGAGPVGSPAGPSPAAPDGSHGRQNGAAAAPLSRGVRQDGAAAAPLSRSVGLWRQPAGMRVSAGVASRLAAPPAGMPGAQQRAGAVQRLLQNLRQLLQHLRQLPARWAASSWLANAWRQSGTWLRTRLLPWYLSAVVAQQQPTAAS